MKLKPLTALSGNTLQKWLPNLASALLVAAIAYALVEIVWLFIDESNPVAVEPASLSGAPSAQTESRSPDYAERIQNRHVFGKAEITAQSQAIDAPETQLNLKLVGVFAIGEENGMAIIASGREEEVYAVGDRIPGNATLKAVYADRVLLESSRGLETLKLPEKESLFSLETLPADTAEKTDTADGSPGEAGPEVSGQVLREYRQRFIRNPASLAEVARIQPAENSDGQFQGYKLDIQQDNPLIQALGLQSEDIVTEVNGIPLDRPENGMRALRKLMKARVFNVTVLRDGQPQQLQLQVD